MLKNLSRLEHIAGNKVYHFICDQDSPLNEVKDALFQFLKYVGQVEDAVKAKQAEQISQEPPKEELKSDKVEDGNKQ